MSLQLPTTDPRWVPPTSLSAFDRWALARLRDERDLVFARVTLGITLTVIPSALVVLVAPAWLVPLLVVPHLWVVFGLWGAGTCSCCTRCVIAWRSSASTTGSTSMRPTSSGCSSA